jgi:hypothetical protein
MRLRKEVIFFFLLQHVSKCASYVQPTTMHSLRRNPTTSSHQYRHLRLSSVCKRRVSSYRRCSFIKTDVSPPPVSSILFSSHGKNTLKKFRTVVISAGSSVSPNNGNDDRSLLQRVVDVFRNFISSLLVSKTLRDFKYFSAIINSIYFLP